MWNLSPEEERALIERIHAGMIGGVPFNTALGMRVEGVAEGTATVLLPYRTELVGNPDTGGLHGGVITSLIDAGCGLAVVLKLMRATRIATLDLRIDYLRPATPPRDVRARCECHKVTRQIAFVRAVAYHDDPGDAIASAAGTFMIFDEGRSPMGETVSKP